MAKLASLCDLTATSDIVVTQTMILRKSETMVLFYHIIQSVYQSQQRKATITLIGLSQKKKPI